MEYAPARRQDHEDAAHGELAESLKVTARQREIEATRIADIVVGERRRIASSQAVSDLARSMEEIGLQTPIHIRYIDEMELAGEHVCNVPVLVAGATRLAAAKQLGWEKIDAVAVEMEDADAELWEIDENLARAELTTGEKREHLKRRKELWEKRSVAGAPCATNELRVDGRRKGPQHQKSFAAETAAATGLSKSQINRLLADPKPAPRPASQVKLPDQPLNEFEATQKQVAALMSAWNKAGAEAREQFLERIDRPVFDSAREAAA